MFRKRRSSQKPDESFYADFKQRFSSRGSPTATSADQRQPVPGDAHLGSTSFHEAIVEPRDALSAFDNVDDGKDIGNTPKNFGDQWRLTPSIMDPNSNLFSAFANQGPVYYSPTPGGFNTFYHSSTAGDLHTPGMGMNTPLSMPHSLHGMQASDPMHFGHFNPHLLHPQHMFQDSYHMQPQHHHQQQQRQQQQQSQQQQQHLQSTQQNFAPPSHFVHQDSGYSAMDDISNKTTPNQNEMAGMQGGLAAPPPIQQRDSGISLSGFTSGEKYRHANQQGSATPEGDRFRYHTTLNAPTAMVRSADEIPVTYLNKGQAYTMSVFDTVPPTNATNLRYRTYVRISFEDEQQRAKTGACWQLWREGRGSNEAHQRGGKLLAVEYVDPNQGGDDELRKPQVELERASFDGFVVNWHPNNRTNGVADCSISVRFNFLSTDFSHSKGVKGIPVRLCAKTELISSSNMSSSDAEVCFAKVKLFRDHGAERKLSNDIAHVKKSIEKLKQQISQAEAGMGTVGKRKRSGSMAKETGRGSAEEDLHTKLVGLQDMFSSTRPMSVLYLRGEAEDDPDLFPVKIAGGEELKTLHRAQTWDSKQSGSESPRSNGDSPTPSSVSLTPKRKFSELQSSVIVEEEEDEEEGEDEEKEEIVYKKAKLDRSASPEPTSRSIKREAENAKDNMYALDVDETYKPPAERASKPVACFYIKEMDSNKPYYRAVYLVRRTVRDLINGISDKFGIDPKRVTQVTHINAKGLRIIVDEDVVREVPEGQDMIVEFAPVMAHHVDKGQEDLDAATLTEGDLSLASNSGLDLLEMWLNY